MSHLIHLHHALVIFLTNLDLVVIVLPKRKFMCLTHSEVKQMETLVSLEQRKVYARLSKKNGWLTLKRPKILEGFQGRAFKGRLR